MEFQTPEQCPPPWSVTGLRGSKSFDSERTLWWLFQRPVMHTKWHINVLTSVPGGNEINGQSRECFPFNSKNMLFIGKLLHAVSHVRHDIHQTHCTQLPPWGMTFTKHNALSYLPSLRRVGPFVYYIHPKITSWHNFKGDVYRSG